MQRPETERWLAIIQGDVGAERGKGVRDGARDGFPWRIGGSGNKSDMFITRVAQQNRGESTKRKRKSKEDKKRKGQLKRKTKKKRTATPVPIPKRRGGRDMDMVVV